MFRRRRPLMRAAAVGGAAYYAGKKVQEGREEEAVQDERLGELESQGSADPAAGGISPDAIEQLKQLAELKDQGVLTQQEFDAQKAKILNP